MTKTLTVLSAVTVLTTSGCSRFVMTGSGLAKTESRSVAAFDQIEFVGSGDVEVEIGTEPFLELTTDDNLLALIETKVDGSRLIIKPTQVINPKVRLKVRAVAPSIKKLNLMGGASARVGGLESGDFELTISGSSDVNLSGKTRELKIVVSGSGNVSADSLAAQSASVIVTGSGKVDLHVLESLDVRITGSGSVQYRGEPKITQKVMGSGSLNKKGT